MYKEIGGCALLLVSLTWTPALAAGNPFAVFEGGGKASGSIWLVGKPGPERTTCTQRARTNGGNSLSFSLTCSGGKSFSLSCTLEAHGTKVSSSCSASIATLSGGGSIRGKTISLSMTSSFGTHAHMIITPSSLSFNSPDAKYVKSLRLSGF